MSDPITLHGKPVKVKYDRKKQLYCYTGGQRRMTMYDLLAVTYLNRKKSANYRSMWETVLIRTEIELRLMGPDPDPDADLEQWMERNLVNKKGGGACT